MLNRQAILEADDLPREAVLIPEWNGSVIVRTLTALERDEFEQTLVASKGKKTEVNLRNFRAKLVALTVVDETGNQIFNPDDVDALGGKSGKALDRIAEVARRLAGLSKEDVDELVKNYAARPERVFAYRLAAKLGYANVDQMLRQISGPQFDEWAAYYQLEPFGRDWHQTATIAQVIGNCGSGGGKGEGEPFELDDFLPIRPKCDIKEEQTLEQQLAAMNAIAAIANARQ